jgi:hypothetical protein
MNITEATHSYSLSSPDATGIRATVDEQDMFIPIDPANRHYVEIMRQVEDGQLVISEPNE